MEQRGYVSANALPRVRRRNPRAAVQAGSARQSDRDTVLVFRLCRSAADRRGDKPESSDPVQRGEASANTGRGIGLARGVPLRQTWRQLSIPSTSVISRVSSDLNI